MEGNIWIESEGLGKGSTAIFYVKLGFLPRLNETRLPHMRLPSKLGQTSFPGLKVLIIDDNGLVSFSKPFGFDYRSKNECVVDPQILFFSIF